jgi:OFA family oxalate/formate antiporter-like MFS transporter
VLTAVTGSWHAVFVVAALMNAAAAILALAVLKPLRMAHYRVLREASSDRL